MAWRILNVTVGYNIKCLFFYDKLEMDNSQHCEYDNGDGESTLK